MKAILLDRDGVLNRERADYVKSWQEFELLPGVLPALQKLAALSLPIAVVSNQSAIGRGLVTPETVAEIHRRLRDLVVEAGGRIDAFYVCPHRPDERCGCRKPQPGLLLEAAAAFGVAPADCLFIGDAVTDAQAAAAAGCAALLVRTGRQGAQLDALLAALPEPLSDSSPNREQTPIYPDLAAAVSAIVATAPLFSVASH